MKIGKRLVLSFIIVALLASIAGVVGLVVSIQTDRNYSKALINNGFSQGDIGRFNTYLNKGGAVVRDIIFLTEESERNTARAELDELKQSTLDALAAIKETSHTAEEQAQITIIDENLPLFQTSRDKVVELGLQNKNEEALALFRSEARPLLNTCMDAATKLSELNKGMGEQVSNQLSTQSTISAIIILAVILVALAVSIFLGFIISRSISRPIIACADRLELMSKGDLHSEVPQSGSRDEVGTMLLSMAESMRATRAVIEDLSRGLHLMAQGDLTAVPLVDYVGDYVEIRDSMQQILLSLNKTMREINTASDQVSSGAEQVSAGAQALSQGATEQASSVEELAATIAEVAEQIKENANSSAEASSRAGAVGGEAEESNRRMSDMLSAMDEISSASGEIGKIIKTIEDIAFQTNILALNAAVEAARAGAAGKGFAVVADEVRNLANKSQEASKNTAALIESTLAAVQHGAQLAGATSDSLHAVVGGIAEVSSTVDKISEASREQAASVAQVNVGVDQISSVVQTNSATAEQSAAASEELSAQAAMLRDLVGQFRLLREENEYAAL